MDLGLGDDDDDLEAELARILGKSPAKKAKQPALPPIADRKNHLKSVASVDMGSDIDDEDVDENDPELLGELQMLSVDDAEGAVESEADEVEEEQTKEISQLDLVRSRLEMYKAAEAKAKSEKESSRARRFNRGVKTLEKLLKRVEGGEIVPYTEIPPEVATNLKPAAPEPQELERGQEPNPQDILKSDPSPSRAEIIQEPSSVEEFNEPEDDQQTMTSDILSFEPDLPLVQPEEKPEPKRKSKPDELCVSQDQPIVVLLRTRRDEYKKYALISKKSGDMATALASVRLVKVCDQLIDSCLAGNTVNESAIPPPPGASGKKPRQKNEVQNSVKPSVPYVSGEIFTIPKTVKEALDQRLDYFEKALRKAETTGARNDIRKLGDIVKVYKNAIRLHQRGSEIPYDRLPTPPGCPPIPIAFKI